jgi:hypothetical protein
MNSKILVWSFLFICLLSGSAAGADNANPADNAKTDLPLLRKAIFGLALHDTGPISDKQESGVDPNWELQFNLLGGNGGVGSKPPLQIVDYGRILPAQRASFTQQLS